MPYPSKTPEQHTIEELVNKLQDAKETIDTLTKQLAVKTQDYDTLEQSYKEATNSLEKTLEETHQLKEKETTLGIQNETQRRDIETLKLTVDKQHNEFEQMEKTHQHQLENQKTRIEEQLKQKIQAFRDTIKEQEKKLAEATTDLANLKQKYDTVQKEYLELKKKNVQLEQKQSTSMFKYGACGVAGGAVGLGAGWLIWGRNKQNPPPFNPNNSQNETQSHLPQYINSQYFFSPLDTQTITNITIYGAPSRVHNTEAFAGHNPANVSSGACSGSPQAYEATDAPGPEVTSDIEFVTNISGSQSSGTCISSHLDHLPLSSSPVYIPSYSYVPLRSPLPDDLSQVYPMTFLLRLTGIGFENWNEKRYRDKGCPVERLPYGVPSGDLIATINGKTTLIECKQRPIVHVETIQRIRGAMENYRDKGVVECLIIATGVFSKNAIAEAQKIGVELCDGKRLLEEIYKDQFFYVPTDASEYDPNK